MGGVAALSATLLLQFAALVDGNGERLPGHELVIADGRIVAVGDDLGARYPDASHVDLRPLTAVPGLIDAHVHITYGLGGPSRGDAWTQLLQETPPEVRLRAARDHAAVLLRLGITSARDLFALDGVDQQLQQEIDAGATPGPRLFLAGTGIHPLVLPLPGDPAARSAALLGRVDAVAAAGAQWLKIFATTGSAADLTGTQVYSDAEIAAVTAAAHARGLRVALHAYGPAAVPAALAAGVDSIEHAIEVDDATLRRWAGSGIAYVPTIDHNRYYAEHAPEYGYDAAVVAELQAYTARNLAMLRRAHQAGVPIVFGSDAVLSMFGQNSRELEWFVAAGLTPAEALRTATVNAARLLGQQDRLGRLAPGYTADIIGVSGDPLAEITALTRRVRWVMLAGRVVAGQATPVPLH